MILWGIHLSCWYLQGKEEELRPGFRQSPSHENLGSLRVRVHTMMTWKGSFCICAQDPSYDKAPGSDSQPLSSSDSQLPDLFVANATTNFVDQPVRTPKDQQLSLVSSSVETPQQQIRVPRKPAEGIVGRSGLSES